MSGRAHGTSVAALFAASATFLAVAGAVYPIDPIGWGMR